MPALSHGKKVNAAKMKDKLTKVKKGLLVTKCSGQLEFPWYSSILPRINFGVA